MSLTYHDLVRETLKHYTPKLVAENAAVLDRLIKRHNEREDAKWATGAGDISMGLTIEAPYPGWPTVA